jgi:hypothetical protein
LDAPSWRDHDECAARGAIMDVLEHAKVPGFLKNVLSNERNIPLYQALRMMPNSDDLVLKINDALGRLSAQ